MGDWIICFWPWVKVLLSFVNENIIWLRIKFNPNFSTKITILIGAFQHKQGNIILKLSLAALIYANAAEA